MDFLAIIWWLTTTNNPDYKDTVARILHHLFSNEAAEHIAWEGIRKSSQKRPFKDLRVKQVLFGEILSLGKLPFLTY